MLNSNTLLTKKRERQKSKSISHHHNKDSPQIEINGFDVIELLYTEPLDNNDFQDENEIINLKESNNEIIEFKKKTVKVKEILTRAKIKDIEEHYISQGEISEVNENCFKCLMTNFLSNELLYFNSRNNLFDYCKHCLINKRKKLFIDKTIYEQNKKQFLSVSPSFLSNWNFFIPKTICKSCFMQLINQKDALYSLKNIFCDTDINSSCKTNYQNYVKYSKSFRKTFRIGPKKIKINKEKMRNTKSLKEKFKLETIILSSSETIENNKCLKKIFKKKKKYNKEVKYDKINDIVFINKSILKDNNIINNENSRKKEIIDNKESKINEINNNKSPTVNNIINFQGQNYINIINHININSDNSINNTNLVANNIELMIDKIKNIFLNFHLFKNEFKNLYESMYLISFYIEELLKKLNLLLIYRVLFKNSNILVNCNCLYHNFVDSMLLFNSKLNMIKENFRSAINFIDDIYIKLNNSFFLNENDKKELLLKINDLKFFLNENLRLYDIYAKPTNNFKENLNCLLILFNDMINQN